MEDTIVVNAVQCSICQSPADLINGNMYVCQKNKCHIGDCVMGIFSDMSYTPDEYKKPESSQ